MNELLTSLNYIFKDWAKDKVSKIPLKQKLRIFSLKELIYSDCETKNFCKSSSVLTIWLQVKLVEDKTTQYFWSTFDDIGHNQTEKSGTQENFLPCFWISAPSSNLSSKIQMDDTSKLSSHLGFLQSQQDLLCFPYKSMCFTYFHITLT